MSWIEQVKAEAERRGIRLTTDRHWSRWCPWEPQPKQLELMKCDAKFVLFGGAVGGGKSGASLMDAIRFVDVPGYSALILRRTLQDLKMENALLDLAKKWFTGTGAKWDSSTHSWRFPSGATIQFGGCDNENAMRKYFGGSWVRIYMDEAQQFPPEWVKKMMSRLRKPRSMKVPTAFRATANPVDVGKVFLRETFVESTDDQFVYIPSKLEDNDALDVEDYESALSLLDPVTRAALRNGDWYANTAGMYAREEQFQIINAFDVPPHVWSARGIDISLTGKGDSMGSSRLAFIDRKVYILEAFLEPLDSIKVRNEIIRMAESDPQHTVYGIENQTASLTVIQDIEAHERFDPLGWTDESAWANLPGYELKTEWGLQPLNFTRVPIRGNKVEGASAFLQDLHDMNVYMVDGPWRQAVIDQYVTWTGKDGQPDDIIDGTSVAYHIAKRLPQSRPKDLNHDLVLLPGMPGFGNMRQ